MNFIAGYLFLTFGGQSEDITFAVLKEIISRRHMHDLFNT
jgi:ecotropic viral integration site 5 protein